jgi:AcrR family transcriptional regulator
MFRLVTSQLNGVKMRKSPAAKPAPRPYHHGDLRAKLIAATEALILERGVDGFSLREVARRAGVSPAAPSHHFGDARGLLSEVAILGFRDFGDALAAADVRGGDDPQKRLDEQGLAYVAFAIRNPARFLLMFRDDKTDMNYAPLVEAGDRAYGILENAIRAVAGVRPGAPLPQEAFGLLLATWSIVHGFAHLALGGKFDSALEMFQKSGAKKGTKQQAILTALLPLALRHAPHAKKR